VSTSSLIGRQFGKYKILELLGKGGMATVYKAFQEDINRYVAVKVLPPQPDRDPQFIERFQLEAQTIARLQHPHILPVYDYGSEGDILYLIMAFVQGGSLADRIRQGPAPLKAVDRVLKHVAGALDFAHRQGIVHRDIKPENILIDREGHALLADFGIAKIVGGDSKLTATGGIVGTPMYLAPEQTKGLPVTAQADIYALGIVVYEMLTGQGPYSADTPMQVALKHVMEPVPDILTVRPNLPPALGPVMAKVMAKEPENRYQSAAQFAEAFTLAIGDQASTTDLDLPEVTGQLQAYQTGHTGMPVGTMGYAAPSRTPPPSQPIQIITSSNDNRLMIIVAGAAFMFLAIIIIALLVVIVLNDDSPQTIIQATNVPSTSVAASNDGGGGLAAATPTTQMGIGAVDTNNSGEFGRLSFSSDKARGDTVNLRVMNLAPPSDGEIYTAWLVNTMNDETLPLGEVTLDPLGNGALVFSDEDGRTLPAAYNAVIITRQPEMGDAPSDDVMYSAQLPIEVTEALREILVESENGIEGGSLLDAALAEADLATRHTSLDHAAFNLGGLLARTEHTVNILLNTRDDYDGNDTPENPGFGIGVAPTLDRIEAELNTVANAPGVPTHLQSDVERVRPCVQNARQAMNELIELERGWLQLTSEAAVNAEDEVVESVNLITTLIEGTDLNRNGRIEPFPGECGLQQLEDFSLLLGNMDIEEGGLRDASTE